MTTTAPGTVEAILLGLVAALIVACSPSPGSPPGAELAGRWALTGSMNEGRAEHGSIVLQDGRVLVVGGCGLYPVDVRDWGYLGYDGGCTGLASAELYDPVAGTWTPTGSMAEGRRNPGLALLRDGKVLVAGGCSGGRATNCMVSAELYDPAVGAWTPTGQMAWPRASQGGGSVIVLPSGQVLFASGVEPGWDPPPDAAERYDPATGTWEPTGPLLTPRYASSRAVLLASGKVLLVGGATFPLDLWGSLTATAELYDPVKDAWAGTGALSTARSTFALTALPTGEVLLAGGRVSSYYLSATAEAELYSPSSGTWRTAPSLHSARRQPAAVLLPSGRVLVAGNWTECPSTVTSPCDPYMAMSAELYDPWLDTWLLTPEFTRYVEDLGSLALLRAGQAMLAGGLAQGFGIRAAQLYQE
jgi:hypothetical protein